MIRARCSALAILLAVSACATPGLAPDVVGTDEDRGGTGSIRTISAVVDDVVDGDTAWVILEDGRREKVRFTGVDAPESTNRHEPFGKEAAAFTRSMLRVGRIVALELDVDERDRYGRLLAYVWLAPPTHGDGREARARMLNSMLVANGFATVLTVPPNVQYVDVFVALQLEARTAGRGLWTS